MSTSTSSTSSSNNNNQTTKRLPFYKPLEQKTNIYKFEKKDLRNVPVIQRFKQDNNNNLQVTEGGRADQAGIKLGDTIVKINDVDIRNMSLAETHKKIESAGNDIKLSVKNFEEDENNEKSVNGHDVILDGKSDSREKLLEKKPEIDRERKVWHPIVWQQPPPPVPQEEIAKDAHPHKRIIRNIRRFFKETENNPELRQKHIEDMLLALPTASKQF